LAISLAWLSAQVPAFADPGPRPVGGTPLDAPPPPMLRGADIVEKLGAQVPPELTFRDQAGRNVQLGSQFNHGRPLLLTLVYFRCPMLCSLVMSGALRSLQKTGWQAGKDFDALTVSFDPTDQPRDAAQKRLEYLQAMNANPGDEKMWPFLTGTIDMIRALTDAVGFRFNYDPSSKEFAHAAAIFVLTPSGTVARYFYGVEFNPRDLRLALVEAGAGRAGPTIDRVLFQCYRYNPTSRKYELFITYWFRIGGLLILAALGAVLYRYWRRESREGRIGRAAAGDGRGVGGA
jgi:protein SCO1/2